MERTRVEEASTFLPDSKSRTMRPFIGKDGRPYVFSYKGGDPKKPGNYEMRPVNNATLRYDEWRTLDDAVIKVARQRLVGFDDLRSNGLVFTLGNAMATTVLTWETMSDVLEAAVSIDPVKRTKSDSPNFTAAHIPIPVIHSDYTISERILQESRTRGSGLDTNNAEQAARKVAEKMEDMLFGSADTLTYGGGTISSYVSHTSSNAVSMNIAWDASTKTGAQIAADVLACKQALIDDRYFGPYMLYIPTSYDTVMDDDYDVSGASLMTIRERIEKINGLQRVQVVDRLPDDTVVMVTMQKDVVDLIDGLPMQNIQWDSEGGMVHNYKVMTIQVPRIKADPDGRSGIAVLTVS